MKIIREEKGMVLVYAMMIAVIMALICVSISSFSAENFDLATHARYRISALQTAEAGIARAIYEVNSGTEWSSWTGDPFQNPLSGSFPGSNSGFNVYIISNLDAKKTKSGYNGEIIPPKSAQIVSIGEAGPQHRKVKRTLICLLRISVMDAYACATTGSLNAVNGDLLVDGIDSVATWNNIAGNVHSNMVTSDNSFVWNGKGLYECDISGKVTTISNSNTVHFYKDDNVSYTKSFNVQGSTNVNLPPPLQDMLPPKNMSSLCDLPAPDKDGNIVLQEGKSYKFLGDGTNSLKITGKLIMNNAKLYVTNGDLVVSGGLEGEGILSVSGYIKQENATIWKWDERNFVGTVEEVVNTYYEPPPPPPHKQYGKNREISEVMGVSFSQKPLDTADDHGDISLDPNSYPPGTKIDQKPTGDTYTFRDKYYNGNNWSTSQPASDGGKWISIHWEYDVYETVARKYEVSISRPVNATISGGVDFDTNNLGGAAIYTQGLLTVNGTENDLVLSQMMAAIKEKAQTDIKNGNASPSTTISEYLKDDMTVTVNGTVYKLTGIQEWIDAHPSLKYKTLENLTEDNSVVLSAISQYLTHYLYFQGVIYSEGGLSAKGKIKIIGGIVVRNTDPRASINLAKGAVITCNGEYMSIFKQYTKNPLFEPTAWHEVY
ncbi:MAG: hypothetical protein LWY06_11350 [Firmicutes bacterium]|nr:hypothetical protein [Bacillota bacterium]